jgi:hypothetical protein
LNFTGNISEDIGATLQALQFLLPLDDPFPNIEIACRIKTAVPVMVATVKHSFFLPKLKLVKNYFPKMEFKSGWDHLLFRPFRNKQHPKFSRVT